MKHFFTSLRDSFSALASNRYWLYLLPSTLIALVFGLTSGGAYLIFALVESWTEIAFIGSVISAIEEVLITVWNLAFEFFVLTLLSPMNSHLSEKIDEHYTGFPFEYNLMQFTRAVIRSSMVAVTALAVQLVVMLVLLVPAWFFGDFLFFAVSVLISSFFLGFAFYDYSLERYQYGFLSSWNWAKKHMLLCLSTGFLFSVFTYIPLDQGYYGVYYFGMAFMPAFMTIFASMLFLRLKGKLA